MKHWLRITSVLLLSLAVFHVFDATGRAAGSEKIIPVPLGELENLVMAYFPINGFSVERRSPTAGVIEFETRKAGAVLTFTATSHSALATRFRYPTEPGGIENEPTGFFEYISRYLDEPLVGNNSSGPSDFHGNPIPSAVLSKIETVVCIKSNSKHNTLQLSGFLVDEAGLVISTAHDLTNHLDVKVVRFDGQETRGEVFFIDTHLDLALIKTDSHSDTVIALDRGRNLLGMGEPIYSIGCPVNLGGTVVPGTINGPPRRVKDIPFWQARMQIHPGSSGSPVLDQQGNLVAIIKGRHRNTESIGFLIPFETIIRFIKKAK
jgi:serine protease Do